MLGNFVPGVHAVECEDVALLRLNGKIAGTTFQFLLDSGASCNFISSADLEKIGVTVDSEAFQSVRLADGRRLETCGKIDI